MLVGSVNVLFNGKHMYYMIIWSILSSKMNYATVILINLLPLYRFFVQKVVNKNNHITQKAWL